MEADTLPIHTPYTAMLPVACMSTFTEDKSRASAKGHGKGGVTISGTVHRKHVLMIFIVPAIIVLLMTFIASV